MSQGHHVLALLKLPQEGLLQVEPLLAGHLKINLQEAFPMQLLTANDFKSGEGVHGGGGGGVAGTTGMFLLIPETKSKKKFAERSLLGMLIPAALLLSLHLGLPAGLGAGTRGANIHCSFSQGQGPLSSPPSC